MKTWHPESYSQQARRIVNNLVHQYEHDEATAHDLAKFPQVSYRNILVRNRMAKMFYRYFRKHNISSPTGLTTEDDYLL